MERLRPLRPTMRYLSRTEVHVFAFSIAASVLLSLYPFLHVMMSLCMYTFKWPAAVTATRLAIDDYFPGALGRLMLGSLYWPKQIEYVSVILLLFTANGIFEPLEVALNRAWGVTKDRSYIKNQLLSFLLILICGGLGLASFVLTGMANQEFLGKLFGPGEPIPRWITIVIFRLIAIPMTMLALFITYCVLPNCRVPVRRVARVACVVGLGLTVLQYAVVLSFQWIWHKLLNDYGPFAHSSSVILFTVVAAMIVLAGAEWSARSEKDTAKPEVDMLAALPPSAKPLE